MRFYDYSFDISTMDIKKRGAISIVREAVESPIHR